METPFAGCTHGSRLGSELLPLPKCLVSCLGLSLSFTNPTLTFPALPLPWAKVCPFFSSHLPELEGFYLTAALRV